MPQQAVAEPHSVDWPELVVPQITDVPHTTEVAQVLDLPQITEAAEDMYT